MLKRLQKHCMHFASHVREGIKQHGDRPRQARVQEGLASLCWGKVPLLAVCRYFYSNSPVVLCSVLSVCSKTSENLPLNNHCIISQI